MRRRYLSTAQRSVKYMTVEPLENGVYLSFGGNGLYYSIDDSEWVSLPSNTNTPSINIGQTIRIKGLNVTTSASRSFSIKGKCKLSGTIMSIIYGDKPYEEKIPFISCFSGAFYNCTSIVSVAPDFLPATTLADNCYHLMFCGCTSLTTAPELPATTLEYGCYKQMFSGCSSLNTAPELPAITSKTYCYYFMFRGCSSLNTAPELPATTLASSCYSGMFSDCSSLTTAPELPATTLADYCYSSMFNGCTSLTTAPELPITTLASGCYYNMFRGCTSLTTAPELPATTLEYGCYNGMFNGCTSLTTAPELPATTLTSWCYHEMFEDCIKLNYIKMLATDISASNCLTNWVYGVTSTGTFVKNPNMTILPTGVNGIPSGWTVVNDGEESGNLITFTINSMSDNIQGEYQAEQGMTWSEWCASEYNVDNFYIDSGSNYVLLTIKGPGIAGYTHYQLGTDETDNILGTDIISTEIYYEIT